MKRRSKALSRTVEADRAVLGTFALLLEIGRGENLTIWRAEGEPEGAFKRRVYGAVEIARKKHGLVFRRRTVRMDKMRGFNLTLEVDVI